MLRVEDWAEIRRLYRVEAMPTKAIARLLGTSENTVKAAIASSGPPRYERTLADRSSMPWSRGCTSCSGSGRTCRRP